MSKSIKRWSWGAIEKLPDGQVRKHYHLHDGQWDVMYQTPRGAGTPVLRENRFCLACAGTGEGKTALGPLWLAERVRRKPEGLWLIVAPSYSIMARATAPMLVNTFQYTELEGRFIESRNQYRLPNGGVIWLLSADRPYSLEAGQFDGCWIDEGGQMKRDAWTAIQARIGMHEGHCLITTTPYGLNWLYTDFYRRFLEGDKTYYCRQWPSISNPAYSQNEYDRMHASLSPQRAAMRYDGKFVRMAGLVYPDAEAVFVDHEDPPPGRLIGGMDFGWANPFCALAGTMYVDEQGNNTIYVWYERYRPMTVMEDHAAALPVGVTWYGDPSRPDSIYKIKRANHTIRQAKNDVMLGIDAVNSRINNRTLVISNRCRALRAELQEYRYPEKDEELFGEKPVDEFNHACDALRYMILSVDIRRMQVAKRSVV